jgi:hypothetical protein
VWQKFGVKQMLSNQPQILEVDSTPLIHIFHRWPLTRFLAQTSGRIKSWQAVSNRCLVKQASHLRTWSPQKVPCLSVLAKSKLADHMLASILIFHRSHRSSAPLLNGLRMSNDRQSENHFTQIPTQISITPSNIPATTTLVAVGPVSCSNLGWFPQSLDY